MANRYWVAGGTGNWSSTTNWSTADGGASGASVPGTADTAYLTNTPGAVTVTVDSSTAAVLNFDSSTFTGTIDISGTNKLTVRAIFTLGASNAFSGNGLLDLGYSSTACTWNTANQTIPWNVTKVSTGAVTMTSNFTIQGTWNQTGTFNFAGSGYTLEVQGGWLITSTSYYINDAANNPSVKITGGYISGYLPNVMSPATCTLEPSVSDITFTTASSSSYNVLIRENTNLVINSGAHSITTTDAPVYCVSWTGAFTDNSGAFVFDVLRHVSGTVTLNTDMYVNNWCGVSATAAGYDGGTIHVLEAMYCYGGTTIAGTGTFSAEFSGTLFSTYSYSGTSLNGAMTVSIANFVMNSPGTLTWQTGRTSLTFTNGAVLKKTAGTIVTTGITTTISGTATFDWANGSIPTLTFSTNTDVLYIFDDFQCATLNMYAGSNLSILNGKTFTATTTVNALGNGLYSNTVKKVTVLKDFVNSAHNGLVVTSGTGTITSVTGINGGSAVLSNSPALSSAYGVLSSAFDSGTDFTLAWTVKDQVGLYAYPILDGGGPQFGYAYTRNNGDVRLCTQSGNYYTISTGVDFTSGTHRVVITKASADASPLVYVDNTLYTGGTVVGTMIGKYMGSLARVASCSSGTSATFDEIVLFNEVKDATWVANDWNSGNLTTYTSAESGIIAGWHLDDTISATGGFVFSGAMANIVFSKTDFADIDATGSSVDIFTYYGTATNCTKVYAKTGDDFGGGAPTAYTVI